MVTEFQMTNHAEVHWKGDSTLQSTQNRYAKTCLGYFDRASGFVGGISMWSSGVRGHSNVIGMEKVFCRIE